MIERQSPEMTDSDTLNPQEIQSLMKVKPLLEKNLSLQTGDIQERMRMANAKEVIEKVFSGNKHLTHSQMAEVKWAMNYFKKLIN